MIKLADLVKEVEQEKLEEGWKENIMALAIAASSLLGGVKGQDVGGTKAGTELTAKKAPGSLDVNFNAAFPSGRYLVKGSAEDDLKSKLAEIGRYMLSNPQADYTINIQASESQVPNYDAEKPGRVKLEVGELAKNRAAVLEQAIQEFANQLRKDGKIQGDVKIVKAPVNVGDVKFGPGDNKDDAKYTKDQYVKATVTAVSKPKQEKSVYSLFAFDGERYFKDNKAYAMVFKPARKTADLSKGGGLDYAYQNVLIRLVKPDKALSGKINAEADYTGDDYVIPWDVWNSARGTTSVLAPEFLKLLQSGKYKVDLKNTSIEDLAKK